MDGSTTARSSFCPARSDLGPSSKRAVQLCAKCDRAKQAVNEARSNLLSLVLHAKMGGRKREMGMGVQKGKKKDERKKKRKKERKENERNERA